jgi:hypothetical protein
MIIIMKKSASMARRVCAVFRVSANVSIKGGLKREKTGSVKEPVC